MSIGLAFVQGLVGGFQKNIEREQIARDADDQRLAGLQDTLFAATAKAAAEGKPVPKQLGQKLRDAKTTLDQSRKDNPIGLFGMGKSDPLNLDMAEIAGTMNSVGSSFIDYGKFKIPINENFFKGTGPGSIINKADLYMKTMDTWLTKGTNASDLKDYMEKNSNWNDKISGDFDRYGETWSLGSAKTLAPDQKDATLIPKVKGSFKILGKFLGDIENITPEDLTQFDMAYNAAEKVFFGSTESPTKTSRKDTVLLPYMDDDKGLIFGRYKFKNLKTLDAIKNITKKNGFGDKVGKYIYHFRKQTEQALPTKLAKFNLFSGEAELSTVFPSLIHAANLEMLGGGKNFVNMSAGEQTKVVNYLNENFTKADGEIDIAGRVRAMAPLIEVPQSELSKFNNQYKTFEKVGISGLKNRNDAFERLVGISVKDFNTKYEANVKSIGGIVSLVNLRKEIPTSSGLVETFKQFFGGISAPTGQADQIVEYLFGRGDKNNDVSQDSLRAIVQKVKGQNGVLKDLANVNEAEAIMIVLAADMARAADPSGRLSNQDFEVQLKRLGRTGFFSTKLGQFAALQTVMDDFATRFQRIEMIKAIEIGSNNGILTPRQLQILYANQKVLALQDKVGMTITGGESTIIYKDEWQSPIQKGPNGEVVIIKEREDGTYDYFIGGKQVPDDVIKKQGQSQKNQDNNLNKELPKSKNELNENVSEKIIGKVVGGDKVNGLKLQGKSGLYLQNKDGTFSLKLSGTGA